MLQESKWSPLCIYTTVKMLLRKPNPKLELGSHERRALTRPTRCCSCNFSRRKGRFPLSLGNSKLPYASANEKTPPLWNLVSSNFRLKQPFTLFYFQTCLCFFNTLSQIASPFPNIPHFSKQAHTIYFLYCVNCPVTQGAPVMCGRYSSFFKLKEIWCADSAFSF